MTVVNKILDKYCESVVSNDLFECIKDCIPNSEFCDKLTIILSSAVEPVKAKIVYCKGGLSKATNNPTIECYLTNVLNGKTLTGHELYKRIEGIISVPKECTKLLLTFEAEGIFQVTATYAHTVDCKKLQESFNGLTFK